MTSILERTLDLAIQIQQIAAPTFGEGKRAEFIRERFAAEGLEGVEVDAVGNVYARWPGVSEGAMRPVIVTAHSDTVFPQGTDLAIRREPEAIHGPGIGDNSLGVAGLLGLTWELRAQGFAPPGDLWLVANVCEEGLGDLKGIRAVVDRFGEMPLAYLVVEGVTLGEIIHRGLGARRYRITARTAGGHSWDDYGKPSAIHALAALVTRLTAIPLPREPRTTLNVGVISGGFSVNTIAAQASLELDLRSEEMTSLSNLIREAEALVAESNREGIAFTAEIIGQRPAGEIPPDHPLVRVAAEALARLGIRPDLAIGSTDASLPLSRGLPCICLGLSRGQGVHTTQEVLYTRPLAQGLAQLVTVVRSVFTELGA